MQVTATRNESPAAAALRVLINSLVTRQVKNWTDSKDMGEEMPTVRPIGSGANIVTSATGVNNTHQVLLDIDHPCWLVKSSTPGHYHLYVEVPGGIPQGPWGKMMRALAEAGVIETGYWKASNKRGYSSLRLPWVKKGQADG